MKSAGENVRMKSIQIYAGVMIFIAALLGVPAFGQEMNELAEGAGNRPMKAEAENITQKMGEDTVTLPLKLALGIALEKNLNIQVEKIRVPISEEAITEKEARFDPSVFAQFDNRRNELQTSSVLSGSPLFKENQQYGKAGARKVFTLGLEAESYFETSRYRDNSSFEGLDPQYRNIFVLTLRQPLLKNFGTKVNTTPINLAKNDLDISKNMFKMQVIDTLNQVEQTYYDLSGANENLKLRKESMQLAEKLLSDNRKRFDAGLAHIGEIQEAETAVAAREQEVIAATQGMRDVTNVLKNQMQIQADSPFYRLLFMTEEFLGAREESPAYEEALGRALESRPDYLEKKIELESRDIMLAYDKNQLLPRLDLIGTFGLNGLSGEARLIEFAGQSGKSPYGGGYGDSWQHLLDADGYQWNVGFAVEYPLGNRADRARYQQSKLFKERSIMDLKNLEDQIVLEIKVALEDIQSSWDRISVAERTVTLAAKSLNQEEERLKAGLSDTFRILLFQRALIDAKVSKILAQVEYQKSLARLHRSMGTNLQRHEMVLNVPDTSNPLSN
jgi:outer membrane protein TolC